MRKFVSIISYMTMCTLLFSSCGTIFSGSSTKIKLEGQSAEPVNITTSKGTYNQVYLPIEVRVSRHGLKGQRINISSENYTYPDIVLGKKVNPWTFANIILGGVIGWSIDLATNGVSIPNEKRFIVSGNPKTSNQQSNYVGVANHAPTEINETPIQTNPQSSVSSRTLKSLSQQVEGYYVGTGRLTLNNKVIEEYEGIIVIIVKTGDKIVGVQVQESDGSDFFYSPLEYQVSKKTDGSYELILKDISSAKITISKNGDMTFTHPKVSIEGQSYKLSLKTKKQ